MDNDKPKAESPASSPAPRDTKPSRPADRDAKAEQKKLTAHELVRKHLDGTAALEPDQHPENHRLVVEHAEEAGLEAWQLRALLARFHADGLHRHSRIHPEVFKAALHEALYGRV